MEKAEKAKRRRKQQRKANEHNKEDENDGFLKKSKTINQNKLINQ